MTEKTKQIVLKSLASELGNAKDNHYRFNAAYGPEFENTRFWAQIVTALETAIDEVKGIAITNARPR